MTYARARLWLGISNVGTLTVLALLALVFRLPALLDASPAPPLREIGVLLALVTGYAAVQFPFDLFGGLILPREYGRSDERWPAFVARWFRGALLHGAVLVGTALLLLWAARLGGFALALAVQLGLALGLLAVQARLAAWIGGVRLRPAPAWLAEVWGETVRGRGRGRAPLLAEGGGSFLTGGIAGVPGRDRAVLPARWLERFDREQVALLVRRRAAIVASGARLRGTLLALAWTTAGFGLGWALAGTAAHLAGLGTLALVATLWSFVGVLVLPTPSRWGVFEADRRALAAGASPQELGGLIEALDEDQDDEPERGRGVETVFHPIPSVTRRLERLAEPDRGAGAWHAARTALFVAWSGLGLLGRAVHCDVGRPEVWVFLPSD